MSDKSPRHGASKKSGKTIKQKRAEKRSKAASVSVTDQIHPPKRK